MKLQQTKPASPPEPSFSGLTSFRLHTLAKLVDQHAEASHRRESGLSLLECRIIGVVGAHGPLAFKRLCVLAELEKSNASRCVARMIEQGWIERQDDPNDQRSFFLLPTAEGRRLRRTIHRRAQARNDAWLSVLSERQRDVFATCLQLLDSQARTMMSDTGGSAAPEQVEATGGDEPPPLAWIDRRIARQLHALLGTALDQPHGSAP